MSGNKLPLRLRQKYDFNDMRRSIVLIRKMIKHRGYTDQIKVDSKKFEVYVNENNQVTYLIPISALSKESVGKEIVINTLASIIDIDIDKPRIIFISYMKGSDHINKLIDITNNISSNKSYYSSLLLLELPDTATTKNNYKYIREWIFSRTPVIEWFLTDDIPNDYEHIMPKLILDLDYNGDTQDISHKELLCRYNLLSIGDVVKIYRTDGSYVHRKVV